jgi:hypothetical protein
VMSYFVRSQVTTWRPSPSVLRGNLRAAGGVFHVYYCTYTLIHLYYAVLMAQETSAYLLWVLGCLICKTCLIYVSSLRSLQTVKDRVLRTADHVLCDRAAEGAQTQTGRRRP